MKHKKTAAIILALLIIFQPLCAVQAPALCSGAPSVCALIDWDGEDWLGLLAHFSAFTGIAYWIYSGVAELYSGMKELEIWDFLSLLLREGLIPHWYYELAPEPPGAFSI